MLPSIRKVIMRCNADGQIYEDGDGRLPEFETKAVLFIWLGFYYAFAYGEVQHADNKAEWGIK